jgi:hypothetical protein
MRTPSACSVAMLTAIGPARSRGSGSRTWPTMPGPGGAAVVPAVSVDSSEVLVGSGSSVVVRMPPLPVVSGGHAPLVVDSASVAELPGLGKFCHAGESRQPLSTKQGRRTVRRVFVMNVSS